MIKHDRSLTTIMPWTNTDEFNVIPKTQQMSLTSFREQITATLKTTDEFNIISRTNYSNTQDIIPDGNMSLASYREQRTSFLSYPGPNRSTQLGM